MNFHSTAGTHRLKLIQAAESTYYLEHSNYTGCVKGSWDQCAQALKIDISDKDWYYYVNASGSVDFTGYADRVVKGKACRYFIHSGSDKAQIADWAIGNCTYIP